MLTFSVAACIVLSCMVLIPNPSLAQRRPRTGGGGGGSAGKLPPPARVRVDAYGYLRWKDAPIDPSRGAQSYRFRLNAANGGQTSASGGFAIQEPGWLTGQVYRMEVDPTSIKRPVAGKPSDPSLSPRAKVFAACEYGGNKYRLEFDVVGDVFDATKGKSVHGTVRVRLIGPLRAAGSTGAPVQEAASVAGTRVRNLVRWPDGRTPNMDLGGPVTAPSGP